MTLYVGSDCKMSIMTGASTTTPYTTGTPLEVARVRDNDRSMSANAIDATCRENAGWKAARAGLRDWSDSFDMIYDPLDVPWAALQTAFIAGTTIVVRMLDVTGGAGIIGPVVITGFDLGEKLDDLLTTKVSMQGAGKPVWLAAGETGI